jgi:hypothetical protein
MALIYAAHMFVFPLSVLQDPGFPKRGFWFVVGFAFISVSLVRFKYYCAWKLSMAALHVSGITYQTHNNGLSDFKLIQLCNPITVESTTHIRQKIANWNMPCQ